MLLLQYLPLILLFIITIMMIMMIMMMILPSHRQASDSCDHEDSYALNLDDVVF